ncbi:MULTISPECIES: LysR family transcriptional regulator [Acetobacter]|uniref:LysR family transcriptional regulator n=2 Tax=Acetobacter TaxID=434 RepID=A0A0U5BBC8_9PROT|nr:MULTISPECIES: LysR family transcriptional regulator [Acetobacter]OAG75311.1 transcriptional regulator LysR [Acetobacter malorum]OUJ02843.1 transcriptional regulator [Acetobacter malorum]CEF41909.1 LysR family transcriptional regulator [Acetobacter senegalensis]
MALDDLTDVAFFMHLVNAGGVTATGKRLGASPAAVSRRLRRLEARLDIALVIRNTRHFHLSDAGQLYYDGGKKIVEETDRLEAEVIQSDQLLQGALSIGAPLEFGRNKLAPFIADFHEKYHGLQLNLAVASEGSYDFADYLDIIIRVGLPEATGTIVTKIASTVRVLCASPEYIIKNGEPRTPNELRQHTCLCLRRYKTMEVINQWVLENKEHSHVLTVTPSLSSTNAEIIHDWALSGKGIAYKLLCDAHENLQNGSLVRILPEYQGEAISLYAVLPSRSHIKKSVRLLLDELKKYIKKSMVFD